MLRLRAFLFLVLSFFLYQVSTSSCALAASKPGPTLDASYLAALAAADHFLQAWQSGDIGNGTALLTSHSKENATTEALENFFDGSRLSAYEVGRGKLIKRGRYEFPVVFVSANEKGSHARRRFSSVVVVDTGNNDWAIDKLP